MFQTCFSTAFITILWAVIEYLASILLVKLRGGGGGWGGGWLTCKGISKEVLFCVYLCFANNLASKQVYGNLFIYLF